jgi:acetyl esterase/lipase
VPRSTPPTVVVPDVRFATVAYGPHPRQLLDVHLPPGPGPHPVLLWVHGGGWSSGARTDDTAVWERYAAEYAVVSVDYRLAPEATWPAQGDDVAAAIDWVRGPAARAVGLDGDRLVVAGWSAGGHLATWAGVTSGPGVVDGVVSLSGALILEPAGAYGSFVDEAAAEMLGGQPAAAADPGLIAGDGASPVFLQQGRLDRTVPPVIGETAARRLRAAGVAVRTETVERDHPYTLTPAVDAFVAEHLGEPATGPTPEPVVAAGEADATGAAVVEGKSGVNHGSARVTLARDLQPAR